MERRRRRHRATGQSRRNALLAAAVEVAAARGIGGVTHRSVTEQAGMPLATVSYFFSSIDNLAAEAMRVFAGDRTAELLALAANLRSSRRSPDEIADAMATASAGGRTANLAQYEAYLHAARTATFRPAVAEAVAAFEQVAEVALRAAGAPEPASLGAAFVALADGMALRNLALPGSVPPDALHRAFRALYLGSLLDAGADEATIDLRPVGPQPVTTPPVTTPPVTTPPVTTPPVTTQPVTTQPVTTPPVGAAAGRGAERLGR